MNWPLPDVVNLEAVVTGGAPLYDKDKKTLNSSSWEIFTLGSSGGRSVKSAKETAFQPWTSPRLCGNRFQAEATPGPYTRHLSRTSSGYHSRDQRAVTSNSRL